MNNFSKIDSTSFEGEKSKTIIGKLFAGKKDRAVKKIEERSRGQIAGISLSGQSENVVREVITRETLACNFDFLRGLNETLNTDLAKKAYKSISEVK